MNYGKSAYLKVVDLEQRLTGLSSSQNIYEHYLEISKPNINQSFSKNYDLTIEFPPFEAKEQKNLCFQISASLSAPDTDISIDLAVNHSIIHTESRSLSGQGDIIVFKTFTPLSDGDITLSITFSTKQDNAVVTLKSISAVVLGASGNNIKADIELRALRCESNILISYIDDSKLYKASVPALTTSLKAEDFSYVDAAISHCYCKTGYNKEGVSLYKVDLGGNLYLDGEQDTLVAKGVKKVFACPCPLGGDYSNIVVYIKDDGRCYYRMVEGNKITSEAEFSFPKGKYVDITAVSHIDSKYLYIIAGHENGSNYIARSLVDVATGKIIENLKIDYMVTATKYIDISFSKNIENIKLDIVYELTAENILEAMFRRCCFSTLKTNMSFMEQRYTLFTPTTYGVYIDTSSTDYANWVSYCDDSADFLPAQYDLTNHVLIDNDWMNRWPLTDIRPCIVKDGEVIGYLDPNDYSRFVDGTPSNHNTKKTGNVMVEFPRMYYKISKEGDKIKLNLSNYMQEGYNDDAFWYNGVEHDKIYVAAYFCANAQYNLYGEFCYSGQLINTDLGISFNSAYTHLALPDSFGYKTIYDTSQYIVGLPYHFANTLSCLFAIMFKTTNTIDTMGNCSVKTNNNAPCSYPSGLHDQKGMFYGEINKTSSSIPKLFGVEALYGVRQTICCGVWLDQDKKLHLADPKTNANLRYSTEEAIDYPVYEMEGFVPSATDERTALDLNGTTETGFFHMNTKGKWTYKEKLGFCDSTYQRTTTGRGGYMTFGMSTYDASRFSGMFCDLIYDMDYYPNNTVNIRFVMYPKI